eukprot:314900-Amphidinium_carterae.2
MTSANFSMVHCYGSMVRGLAEKRCVAKSTDFEVVCCVLVDTLLILVFDALPGGDDRHGWRCYAESVRVCCDENDGQQWGLSSKLRFPSSSMS